MIGEGAQGDVAASTRCILSDWEDWSACSASCGSGTRSRSRAVIADGDECRVPLDSMETCQESPCLVPPVGPIDGPGSHCELSDWEEWSACSASCGSGTRSRSRAVIADGDECRVPLDSMV